MKKCFYPGKSVIRLLLMSLLLSSACAWAQNVPLLNEVSVPGSVTTIPSLPPDPTLGNGSYPFDYHYVTTYAPVVPIKLESGLNTAPLGQVKKAYAFKNGFNQTFQAVLKNYSVQGTKDLITVTDTRPGRDRYAFLPFASSGSDVYTHSFLEQGLYYLNRYPGEAYTPYSATKPDPVNRDIINYAPGKSQIGQGRGIRTSNSTNRYNEVRYWQLNAQGWPITTSAYEEHELYRQIVTDQDNGQTVTFKDKDGRLVLKHISDKMSKPTGEPFRSPGQQAPMSNPPIVIDYVYEYASTYYVYDDMGRLCYTIPPKAVQQLAATNWALDITLVNQLCFQYKYDDRGRMYAQRKPDEGGLTLFVYDRQDRLVMRQTPNEAANNQWELSFYDRSGRLIATSLYTSSKSRQDWQDEFDNGASGFPTSDIRHFLMKNDGTYPPDGITGNTNMSLHYYDNYKLIDPDNTVYNNCLQVLITGGERQNSPGAEVPARSQRTQGLSLGSMTRILPAPGADITKTGDWQLHLNYYDDKGRAIYSITTDLYQLNPVRAVIDAYQYDFAGRVLVNKRGMANYKATDGRPTRVELTRNIYDHTTGLLSKVEHKIDSKPWKELAAYTYDDFNRVKRETLGDLLETRDYDYNIRGQLTDINRVFVKTGDMEGRRRSFGESIRYDYGFSEPRYDGKVAGVAWCGSEDLYAYGYHYDAMGRMTAADYHVFLGMWYNDYENDHSVSNLTYDKNGNLLTLTRKGFRWSNINYPMDDLSYGYQEKSNRLLQVDDAAMSYLNMGDFEDHNSGIDYAYDANGNLTQDLNKGITLVTYTHFNQPEMVTFANGGTIKYTYTASGAKVQEIVNEGGSSRVRDHIGNYVYENNKLYHLLTPYGRTVFEGSEPYEEIFVKDRLGNIRSVLRRLPDLTSPPFLMAGYELEDADVESRFFDRHSAVRADKPGSTDPLDAKAARLNGGDPERRVGSAMMLKVMAGDSVRLNVESYYAGYSREKDKPMAGGELLEDIAGALMGGGGSSLGRGEVAVADLAGSLFSGTNLAKMDELLQEEDTDPSRPQAYLNYVLFKEDGSIYGGGSGRFQAEGDGEWKRIGTGEEALVMPRNGYLAVYLSNASTGGSNALAGGDEGDVFFDLLSVWWVPGPLLEENHYYPFGLPIKDKWSAHVDLKAHRFRYQGNEYVTENGLNWMDFNFRQYDPQIGRFLSVDPLAEAHGQDSWSPYAAMGNSPGMMVDPEGLIVQEMASGNELPPPGGMLRSLFPTIRIGGATIWLPTLRGGEIDLATASRKLIGKISVGESPVSLTNATYAGQDGGVNIYRFGERNIAFHNSTVTGHFNRHNSGFNWGGVMGQLTDVFGQQKYGGDAWTRAAHMGMMPYKPDAMGITLSGNLMGLNGLHGSISIGIVGNKFGMWYTRGVGVGLPEVSGGVSFFAANFKGGGVPTLESFARGSGDAFNGSIGAGGISLIGSYGRAFDNQGDVLWNSYSIGAGVYSPFHSLPINIGGSWQSTYSDIIWSW